MVRIVYPILAVVGVLAVAGLILGLVAVRQSGLNARDEPGAVEARLARFMRGVAIPDAVRRRANPLSTTPETIVPPVTATTEAGRRRWDEGSTLALPTCGSQPPSP
jgi:hypothetical protein